MRPIDNKPLSIEELQQMNGEPVWIEQENAWGIVHSEIYGPWANTPLVTFYYGNVRCDWLVEIRCLRCYRHPLVRRGRWEWFEEWNPSTPDHPRECEECGWKCSECETALEDMVGGYWDNPDEEPQLPYCPNCGVKMMLRNKA